MITSDHSCKWISCLASWLAMGGTIASFDSALAQIAPDGILGAESSVVTPQTPSSPVDVISGGATRGANLFHSFEQFSVQNGRTAFFNNAADIQNIISRVTGFSISNIDGLIRANGAANLFLLNPNGIIFGPNAQLNIGGSFMASTASSLNFADGAQFSATAPTTTLLTVSVPLGLQYGRTVKSIRNQSQAINSSGQAVGLQVQPGKTLALVGGDVELDGGNLQAPDSRVELGGLAEAGTLGLNVNGNNLSLSFPNGVARADVSLTNGSAVDVTARGGGSIAINARNVDVLGGSSLSAGTQLGLEPVGRSTGDITLNATDAITVEQMSSIGNNVAADAIGQGGNLMIKTGQLLIRDGGRISTSTLGQGQGGDLDVIASDSVEVAGRSPNGRLSSLAADTEGTGTAGNLRIQTRQLLVRDRGTVSAETSGVGKGGDLNITSGLLDVQNSGTITVGSTSTNSTAKGAGRLEVTAQTIRLHNQAAITANTASGQGGNIILRAQNLLLLRDNSVISTTAGGSGNGGNIKIDTDILAALEDSDITANAFTGTGGNIQITTQGLFLSPDSQITASSERGIDGVVEINAPDINPSQGLVALPAQLVDTSGLIAQTCPASRGQGQSEFIVTGRGGLPDNPSEMLNGDAIEVNLATLNPKAENRSSPTVSTNPTAPAPVPIVEAQGWVTGKNGEVILTAFAPTVTAQSPGLTPESCIVPRAERR